MRTKPFIATALVFVLLQSLAACRGRQASMRMSANESAAIAQLHALFSAEVAFNTSKNHYACTIAELAESPGLIDREMNSGQKNGYAFTIHCSPQIDLPAYQVWANPQQPGETGVNLYCTDETGVIRRTDRQLDFCSKAKPVE